MITLKHISKNYNQTNILRDINLSFRENEFVCILGPSGSGKTTLLNIIGALDTATKGNVYIGNKNIKDLNMDIYHNKIVSFIFQNYNLINNLNINDNLTLPLKLTNKIIDYNKVKNTLQKFGIKNDIKSSINNLSGGEKQRIAIIRSILADTKIILGDEPTGALDTLNSENVMEILKGISKNKLVIVVTHNEALAQKYASRIIRIKDGQIISDTNPYIEQSKFKFLPVRTKLKWHEKIKISLMNLKSKKARNLLTILAFSIGLFSLSLVLSISYGFSRELDNLEHNSLYNYPLIISKEMYADNTSIFDNTDYSQDKININPNRQLITNNFDIDFFSKVDKIKNDNLAFIAVYRDNDLDFANISYINPNNDYFDLIAGKMPTNSNEVLLLLDYNNSIDEIVKDYLKLEDLNYDAVLNKNIYLKDQSLTITGIVKSTNEYFSSLNGILYSNDLFDNEILSIYIYPTNYKNKEEIKSILYDYNIIDNAKDVVKLTNSLISGISLVLTIFSIISLIVSSIMISVMSYISIMERKMEIGIMESLGTNKKDIKSLILTENSIIALSSSIVAIFLTFLISNICNKYISKIISFDSLITINFKIILFILLLSLFLSKISGMFPTSIIKKKSIIDNISNT